MLTIEEHYFEVLKVKHADGRIESIPSDEKRYAVRSLWWDSTGYKHYDQHAFLSSTVFRCSHRHTGKLRIACLIWTGTLLLSIYRIERVDKGGMQLGRNRNVLKDFFGDAKIKSLQRDSYNVYMNLDDELIDVEFLLSGLCTGKVQVHLRPGMLVVKSLPWTDSLIIRHEETYHRKKLNVDEIHFRRNGKATTELIEKTRTELYDLLANRDESRNELMGKYLNSLT